METHKFPIWILVGGLEHVFLDFFHSVLEATDVLRFCRGVAQPPTRINGVVHGKNPKETIVFPIEYGVFL